MIRFLLTGLLLSVSAHSQASQGPYVVDASSTSAVICWGQDPAKDCRAFSRLKPAASFSYSVPSSTLSYSARSLPAPDRPLRFAAFGDSGLGSEGQWNVAGVLAKYDPDLVLLLGDIIYPAGEEEEYESLYFEPYAATVSRVAVFPTPGNHDYGNSHSPQEGERRFQEGYARFFHRPKYYSFDAGPAHFVSLDTNEAYPIQAAAPIGPGSAQRNWLEEDLARSKARWKFVYMHVPLYSTKKGHGDNAYLRKTLEPLFQKYGVDVVFGGHDHIYQRSRPLSRTIYLTVGTGGGGLNRGGVAAEWLEKEIRGYGLVTAELGSRELVLRFLDEQGQPRDEVRLAK